MEDIDSEYAEARRLREDRDFVGAAKAFRRIADAFPDRSVFRLLAAASWERAGMLNEALCESELAVEAEPNSYLPRRELGKYLLSSRKLPEARRELLHSIAIKPTATAHLYLALLFYELNDLETAEQHAVLSTQLAPDFGDAFYKLGAKWLENSEIVSCIIIRK